MALLSRILASWLLLLTAGAGASDVAAQAARASEYRVKAVFLFNFAQFVDWPPTAFPDSGTPFVIGILGDDPFGAFLDETVRGEQSHGRSFQVRRYQRVDEIGTCHILFIGRPDGDRLDAILGRLKDRPILTVSDDPGFADHGGMVRFLNDRNRVRLQINPEAAQAVNLTISSKLLRVAEIATPRGR
jgi:hypothetical protein